MISPAGIIEFILPAKLACPEPSELRGLERDEVRLLVTRGEDAVHTLFKELPEFVRKGDVLVVNTSATRPSAFRIELPGGGGGMVHFSTPTGRNEWLAEIREIRGSRTIRWKKGREGMVFRLKEHVSIRLKGRYHGNRELIHLWRVDTQPAVDLGILMARAGLPVRYEGLDRTYPMEFYQTFFSFHPGSAEMPSAGRGFTERLVARLLERGVQFAPVLLHAGISSLEENEPPYPEYREVSPLSSAIINHAMEKGNRIIAVGTTVVRALESAAGSSGEVSARAGFTDLFIEENYRMKIVGGLLTGFHEPRASHLHMLKSIAGHEHIVIAYETAIGNKYYWHQFGDLHLILPS